jgi:antirestriction protein ArdC
MLYSHSSKLSDYAASTRRFDPFPQGNGGRRGITSGAALWALCRYRHNAHWSKHPSRLARDFGRKTWGDEGYAQEELVAELTSAFLCADLELTPEVRDDHAAYIASWLTALKNDKRMIFTAAAHAQRAADFLHALQTPRTEAA